MKKFYYILTTETKMVNFDDCIEWLIKEGYFNKEYLV